MTAPLGRPVDAPGSGVRAEDAHTGPPAARSWARTSIWLLPAWGLLLAVSTLTHQPDYKTDFEAYADYVTTTPFLVSHLVASIGGAALAVIGAAALAVLLIVTPAARTALWGLAAFAAGQVLATAVFGVAAFFQPAAGRAFLEGDDTAARSINDDVYGAEVFAVVGAGMLLMVIGAALLGRAARESRTTPAWATWMFALAVPLFAVSGFTVELLQPVAGVLIAVSAAMLARGAAST